MAGLPKSWTRLDGVDLLRGLAILLVLLNHVNIRLFGAKIPYLENLPAQLATSIAWNGQYGVQIPNPVWREYSYLGRMDAIAFGCLTAIVLARKPLAQPFRCSSGRHSDRRSARRARSARLFRADESLASQTLWRRPEATGLSPHREDSKRLSG